MKAFSDLFAALDATTKTGVKVQALADYFRAVGPEDGAWAVYFLSGRKLRQAVPTRRMAGWANDLAGVEPWLFEECYHAVGDLAETIALLLPDPPAPSDVRLSAWVGRLKALRGADEAGQRRGLVEAWAALDRGQRLVWNKLITGGFRVGVSQSLLTRALAAVAGVEVSAVAHRLMGGWEPTAAFFTSLLAKEGTADGSRPYPFFLASPLDDVAALGDAADWQAEWKWDGIRAQLVKRDEIFLWSRGEELVTERYPEIASVARFLPAGTVLDGEILPWREGVLPFAQLQRRIGLKAVGKKILADVPVVLLAYDLIEHGGVDLRDRPLGERRALLERVVADVADPRLLPSPVVTGTWEELAALRETSRGRNVEGLMLKRRSSPYRVGRVRGDWWKWKVGPLTLDAVLVYAQRGSGNRASLYTDYTFALRDGDRLVPFAKAYSGLTDAEIADVDGFVRRHTVEQFGPVRSVKPELVFELAFEGIQRSPRHKSGIAVRFPRILRQRTDKTPADADTLESAKRLLGPEG
ncbi:MAG: ATP-dependent DNA ligase [Gemmataceae bacterium]